eukprot:sb/3461797/
MRQMTKPSSLFCHGKGSTMKPSSYVFYNDYYDNPEWVGIVESSDWCENLIQEDGESNIYQYPLFNGSRCFPFELANPLFGFTEQPYCKNGYDQTNCSDPTRVAGECLIRGYPSTVSTLMTCLPGMPGVCDDGIDLECVQISQFCRVHRHKLCDNTQNCPLSLDETIPLCDNLSKKSCKRSFDGSVARIPFPWVRDGVMDCANGEDEADGWSSCGEGSSFRYSESECREVFFCRGLGTFKELEKVCDASTKICEKERSTCEKSMEVLKTFDTLLRLYSQIFEPLCLPGLEGHREMVDYRCLTIQLSERKFYGETNYTGVLSMKHRSCRNLFGETYVLMSCLELCNDATCPIVNSVLSHLKCPNIQRKIYALDSTGSLTFAVQDHGRFHNDFFLCENELCVPFEHVCNLRDNCGDGSDEKNCSNNFICKDGRKYLGLVQKCDGKIDCHDISDECNEECSMNLIPNTGLLVVGGIMGTLGIPNTGLLVVGGIMGTLGLVLNIYTFTKGAITIRDPDIKEGKFMQICIVQLISLGDMLISGYLLTIITFSLSKGDDFCASRLEWETGLPCKALGLVTTTGSVLSSLAMASLSIVRLQGILRSIKMQISNTTSKRLRAKMMVFMSGLVIFSVVLSIIPLLAIFENMFVNGLSYGKGVGLFLGSVSKKKHLEVILGYFGRTQKREGIELSWESIRKVVGEMFSSDIDGVVGSRVPFYANHPVCQFKYFLTPDDPQLLFVWLTLGLLIACFTVVIVCHGVIAFLTTQNSIPSSSQYNKVLQLKVLQRKVTMIVLTDTTTWVPFLIFCALHTAQVVDMSPYYPIFSIVILPFNSVMNPLLYSECYDIVSRGFSRVITLVKIFRKPDVAPVDIELEDFGMVTASVKYKWWCSGQLYTRSFHALGHRFGPGAMPPKPPRLFRGFRKKCQSVFAL